MYIHVYVCIYKLLTFSDGRDPVPVVRDSSMTGNPEQQCWKAMNYGNQGEGLLQGKILDYLVDYILDKKIAKTFNFV